MNLTTVAYVTTTDYIKRYNKLFDGNVSVVKFQKHRAIDINDEDDLKIAKSLITNEKIKTILITGANGRIGSVLTKFVLERVIM